MQFIPELEKHMSNLFVEDDIVMLEAYRWIEKYQKDIFNALGETFPYSTRKEREKKKLAIISMLYFIPPKVRIVLAVISFVDYMGVKKAFDNQGDIRDIIGSVEDYRPFDSFNDFANYIDGLQEIMIGLAIQALQEVSQQILDSTEKPVGQVNQSWWRKLWLRLKKKQ